MRNSLIAAAAAAAFASVAAAQAGGPAAYVRGLYRDYFNIEPPPGQLNFWVTKMATGTDADEVHANILGSAAFVQAAGPTPGHFVNAAFTKVIGRPPRPDETAYWLTRYRRVDGDTVKWSRDFLRANGGRLNPAVGNPAAVLAAADIPGRLLTTCRLFLQAARAECGGPAGLTVQNQGRNFVQYVSSSMATLRNPGLSRRDYFRALNNVERGVTGVRQALAGARLNAPQTRLYNDQIEQLVDALRGRAGGQAPPAFAPPRVPGGPGRLGDREYRQLRARAADLQREIRETLYFLRGESGRGPRRLARDIEGLGGDADAFRAALRPGASRRLLQSRFAGVRNRAEQINRELRGGLGGPRLSQKWYQVARSLNIVAGSLGVAGTSPPPGSPGRPPVRPRPPAPGQNALRAIRRAEAACDAFSAGWQPYSFYNRSVPRLLAEVRDLRGRLGELNSRLAAGRPGRGATARLTVAMNAVEREYRSAARSVPRTAPPPAALRAAVGAVIRLVPNR